MCFTIPLILSVLSRFWSSYVPHHGPHGPADAPSNGHEAPRTGPLPIPGSSADGRPCKSPWRPLDSYTATSLLRYEQGKYWKNTSILEFKPWQKRFFLSFWFIITLNGFCYLFVSFYVLYVMMWKVYHVFFRPEWQRISCSDQQLPSGGTVDYFMHQKSLFVWHFIVLHL